MAFKMKGPSLLKMVKQMREGSPMKKDGETTQTAEEAAAKKAAERQKMRKEIMEERKLVKIPKKKIKPLPIKDDAKIIKAKEDRPDPTFEGTDEFRSLDEIRSASRK